MTGEQHRGPGAPVAITGIGAITSVSRDAPGLGRALFAPAPAFAPSSRYKLGFPVQVGEVPEAWFAEHSHDELDTPTGRLCLAAARECLGDALGSGGLRPDGIALGTSTGGQSRNEEVLFGLFAGKEPLGFSYRRQGCMAAPTRLVARDLKIEGPVATISTACTSAANAIALGAWWIRSGRCQRVLAGGGDALCFTTIASFHALELTGEQACAPFGPQRPGMTLGEGAGFLLLEQPAEVLARGQQPLAELVGIGMSNDAHHMTAPRKDGAGATLAMGRAIADAGISAQDICYINAHGTGTKHNDAAEATAIGQFFGSEVWVSSIKGLVGHTLGGAGGVEAVAAIQAIRNRRALENVGASTPGTDCPVRLVGPGGQALATNPYVLSNSFAFGGNNCSLVFRSAREAVA